MSTIRNDSLAADLKVVTQGTGAAIVRTPDSTYVVVEVDQEPVVTPDQPYVVTETHEAAALMDALDETGGPLYATPDALAVLRELRRKRQTRD